MEKQRCKWANPKNKLYIQYHDEEWGVPVHDDQVLFEFIVLESAQAGLSWETVLNKRENYRIAFDQFDPEKVATYDNEKIETLLQNPGIIRNRAKVAAAVNNAQKFLEIQAAYGSFDQYIWQFVEGTPKVNHWKSNEEVPATTAESDALSKDLKQKGFKFMGSTICYAHMQATGMVNDHTLDCFRYAELKNGHLK
ncbi:DNA-3-methyladenine glycosylase I [Rapidithrix thailandica]|uniref:DNA-3-methyladenine glycosylase I n=1 Tax=Rapidithrix thailandica TaxID=413964 RepID=A0AAW9SCV6_9BACT